MEVVKPPKHFVLIHGLCHGAWCWYKLKPHLQNAGYRVTALDMAASGINMKAIEEVHTFTEYNEPLLQFMASLPPEEKVILVGHSLGGMNLAFAMETYPEKISAAVFLDAFLPDTIHQPSYVLEKFMESIPKEAWLDTEFSPYGSPDEPSISMLLGSKFLTILYSSSAAEDIELALLLKRPSSLFISSLSKMKKLSNERYGSVKRVYVIGKEDKAMIAFSQWNMENSGGLTEVIEIEGADHMSMISKPHELCNCLLQIADKHA
ncbi:hypothetical protein Ancab_003743 [Ancistrocladus abbreviatus]